MNTRQVEENQAVLVHERIRQGLKSIGVELHSLEDVDSWGPLIQAFNIPTASAPGYVEALESAIKSGEHGKRQTLIWELEKLAAMSAKLWKDREERERHIQYLETRHHQAMVTFAKKMDAAETRLCTAEAQLQRCRQALAQEPPAPAGGGWSFGRCGAHPRHPRGGRGPGRERIVLDDRSHPSRDAAPGGGAVAAVLPLGHERRLRVVSTALHTQPAEHCARPQRDASPGPGQVFGA